MAKSEKPRLEFAPNAEPVIDDEKNALLTQLMVQVLKTGMRVDKQANNNDIIAKEIKHGI